VVPLRCRQRPCRAGGGTPATTAGQAPAHPGRAWRAGHLDCRGQAAVRSGSAGYHQRDLRNHGREGDLLPIRLRPLLAQRPGAHLARSAGSQTEGHRSLAVDRGVSRALELQLRPPELTAVLGRQAATGPMGHQHSKENTMSIKQWLGAGVLAAAAIVQVAQAATSEVLVSTDWLEQNLEQPDLRIIEVSVNPGQYERGHIPGAVNVSWHTDLVDPVRRDIASAEDFQKLLREAGVSSDSTVILYGDNNNWFAAWGAWVFDVYGVENVKLLDGGRAKWEKEGRPLTTRQVAHAPGNISLGERNEALRARFVDVVAVAEGKQQAQLIDIRSPDEFNGRIFAPEGVQELAIRAGHIPGAVNVPWSWADAADGIFKTADELCKVYVAVGVDGSKPIITYCRIGERSSHPWLALSKILGYDVRNYDGSWTEYGNAVGVTVVNVAGTVWGGK